MEKVKACEPLIKNFPLGGYPPLAIVSTLVPTMIYGVPGTIVGVILWAIAITVIVRYDNRLINESVVKISDCLSKDYGIAVNHSHLKEFCKVRNRGHLVNVEALNLNTDKIHVYSLRFNRDYTEVTPSMIQTHQVQKT